MNYVASSQANGSIGYVEYSTPSASTTRWSRCSTRPATTRCRPSTTWRSSLEAAQINMDQNSPDYLLQNLTNVYTDPDPRTYPLSSYVYMIEPTGTYPSPETKITTGKAAVDRRLRVLLDLPGTEGDRADRLLAAAGQPGRGRLRPDRTSCSRPTPAIDLTSAEHPHLRQPDLRRGPAEHQLPGHDRPAAAGVRQGGAGPCAAGVTPNGIGATPTSSGTSTPGRDSAATGGSGGGPRPAAAAEAASGAGGGASAPVAAAATGTHVDPARRASRLELERRRDRRRRPQIVPAELAGYTVRPRRRARPRSPSSCCLLAFVLPPVIGYRMARRRRRAEQ